MTFSSSSSSVAVLTNRTTILGTLAAVTAVTTLSVFWIRRKQRQQDEEAHDNDDDKDLPLLPPHVERDLYKEQRRKRLIPFLTMKKPMYDNILMQDPDGNALSTISLKKANWYVNKNLADWIEQATESQEQSNKNNSQQEQSIIRLRFEPNRRVVDPDQAQYHVTAKANQCVVCGAGADQDQGHGIRHYVVPFCYRTLFPDEYKTHLSHDVVLMCIDCHVYAEQCSQRRRKQLEKAVQRADPTTALPHIIDRHKQTVAKQALALLRRINQMPAARIAECQASVRDFHGLSSDDDNNNNNNNAPLSTELLQTTAAMSYTRPNPTYIASATLVVEPLLAAIYERHDDGPLAAFVRDWRTYFLQTSQPRYLPKGWSVDSAVHCDKRGSYNHKKEMNKQMRKGK